MNKLALALALTLVTGCETMREHPYVTGFVATSLALTAGGAFSSHSRGDDRHIPSPSVDCGNGSCK